MTDYERLELGPIDELDSAVFSGDNIFESAIAREKFRGMMARWEKALRAAEEDFGFGDD